MQAVFILIANNQIQYVYINCHTYFSLRYGTLSVDELVEEAQAKGIEILALTDIHNTSAAYDFVAACRDAGIQPVLGMEFRRDGQLLYIALAKNNAGFHQINAFYSQYAHKKLPFPELPPKWNDVFIIYPWERRDEASLGDHEFLGIRAHQLKQLFRSRFRYRREKLTVLQPVTFADKKGYNLHRLLRAIDHNTLLSKLSPQQTADKTEYMVPPGTLRETFRDYPDIIKNTDRLLAQCGFNIDFRQSKNRQTFTGGKYEDMVLLEKLATDGLSYRYGSRGPMYKEAKQRLRRELDIIDQLNFNAYFLITWDFVTYGKSRGFFHVGRGSGANSITAYCLGITDVDPIELDLYFERFLNPMRNSPPDFDIDYSWKDRDEVIDYVFKRYRHSHTSMLATYNTFKYRSTIRELGKVFGLPKHEIDKLTAPVSGFRGRGITWKMNDQRPQKLAGQFLNKNSVQDPVPQDKIVQLVMRYAQYMEGFPNHLSVHAGGVLIAEEPMHHYTATDLPPKGFPITHFDMYVAEEVGLYKFDILSQRGLGHIRDAATLIYENKGTRVDVHTVDKFKKDEQVKQLLVSGRTIGCFYIESPAMRGLIRKLACDNYLTLVAASSIIRPGVAKSGMMQKYIERHHGIPFEYTHPRLKDLLHDTYGVMVYQEDVIKVAHHFAGMDLAAADMLRRAMSGKYRSSKVFEEISDTYFRNCEQKGYPGSIAKEVWRQIESFAGYSFSKAHSASFAVESYQSLYLKAHFPLEFMVAVINNFGGFYRTEIYLHEAKKWGAAIHAPCINQSGYLTSLKGNEIYLGFIHLKEIGAELAESIVWERQMDGPYINLQDFLRRIEIGLERLNILIRIGAFHHSGKTKKRLLWEARLHFSKPGNTKKQKTQLFPSEETKFELPRLTQTKLEDAYDEMELLGFPIASPFQLLKELPETEVRSRDFPAFKEQVITISGYLVTVKNVTTVKKRLMHFATFLDNWGDFFEVTIFPPEAANYPVMGRGVYRIEGKVVVEFGLYSLEMKKMEKIPYLPDPRKVNRPILPPKAKGME